LSKIKSINNDLDAKVRSQETMLKIKHEEHTNLVSEKETKSTKIKEMNDMIDRQNEMVEQLSKELKEERKENEYNKNKLAVCLVQLRDLEKNNKILFNERNHFEEKYNNIEDLHTKQSLEYDTLKFKHTQLSRDLMDTIVKMNLSVKARQASDNLNIKIMQRIKELEDEGENTEKLRKKDLNDIERLRKINQEFQNEVSILTKKIEDNKLIIKNNNDDFNDKLNKLNDIINKERNIQIEYKEKFEEEKRKYIQVTKDKLSSDRQRRDSDQKYNRLNIEFNSLKEKFNLLTKQYDALRGEFNDEVNNHTFNKNRLDWYTDKLDNLRRDENERIRIINENNDSVVLKLNTEIENLNMHLELFNLKFIELTKTNDSLEFKLKEKNSYIDNFKNEIENFKNESEDLNKKLEKLQNDVKNLQLDKHDLKEANNNLENRIKVQKK